MQTTDKAMRWVWRAGVLAALLVGWMFILFHNNFHITTPVVIVMLGFTAGVCTIYALFRTGTSLVDPNLEREQWEVSAGARGELEREKRTLLKAIKEAEFDHQMGKLSKRDVDEMVRTYRLRAIEVIKLLEGGGAETPREQIQREIRARLEVESVRAKIERAHAGMSKRKNKAKAAAAAQAAARAAAVAGASPAVAAAAAAAAAERTDHEPDDEPAPAAAAERTDHEPDEPAPAAAPKTTEAAARAAATDGDDTDGAVASAAADKPDAKEATP